MTSGKWLILALLIILAALITLVVKDKHPVTVNRPVSPSTEIAATKIKKPKRARVKKVAAEIPLEKEEIRVPANARHLWVIVQDENGQPLPDARVLTKIRAEKNQTALTNFNADLTTDATGVAEVLWPMEKFQQLEFSVSKTNYAARKMTWDFATGDSVPESYTIKLKSGFHMGGFVVDPEGNPVAGAKIILARFWSGIDEAPQPKGEQPAFSSRKQTTGADGRWSAQDLPLELIDRISIEAKHTNFLGARIHVDPKVEKELRAETHKLVLLRGLEVAGRVLDEHDTPIAGATVWSGRKFSQERQENKSDERGGFLFRNVKEGQMLFSVMANGYEPASQTQKVSSETPEVVFRLAKGTVIAGHVLDKEGQPVQGARIVLEGNPGDAAYDHYEFSQTTGKDGKFEWTSAPNQPMPFYIGKLGYMQKRGVRLKPGEDNVVTLLRTREIKGQVLNAETDQPVTQFRIVSGRMSQAFYGDSYGAKDFTSAEGLFTFEVSDEYNNGLQASAKDFAEQVQALPAKTDEEPAPVIFRLKPSPALEGVVITPNGQPVAGATVALVDGSRDGRSVQFSNGRMRASGSGTKVVITDGEGHFSLPSPPEEGTVAASAEEGFASASLAEVRSSGVLRLQVFGRVEGVLLSGTAAAEGQEVMLSSSSVGISFDFNGYKAACDANGRFALEKVPAGTWSIVRLVKTSSRSWSHSHSTEVKVIEGQTSHVTLGGVDATLQARVSLDVGSAETDLTITGNLTMAGLKLPPGLTPEEARAFMSSPEWKAQMKTRKNYSVLVGKDGSLILDSVAPGDYTLTITAKKSSDESFNAKPVARGEAKVTVPPGSSPTSPIDLGEIILKSVE